MEYFRLEITLTNVILNYAFFKNIQIRFYTFKQKLNFCIDFIFTKSQFENKNFLNLKVYSIEYDFFSNLLKNLISQGAKGFFSTISIFSSLHSF